MTHPIRRGARCALLALALVPACNFVSQDASGGPTDDRLSDTHYENDFFGFSLPLREGWAVAPREAEEHLRKVGNSALAGDDALLRAQLEDSLARTHQLLTLSEQPLGSPVPFNPSLIVLAEGVGHLPGVTSGPDFLGVMDNTLQRGAMPYHPTGGIEPLTLGGRTFHRRDYALRLPRMEILQAYLVRVEGDWALGFILTARTPDQLDELIGFAEQVRFHGD